MLQQDESGVFDLRPNTQENHNGIVNSILIVEVLYMSCVTNLYKTDTTTAKPSKPRCWRTFGLHK